MKIFRVLFVDSTDAPKQFFPKRFQDPESIKFSVTRALASEAETIYRDSVSQIDLIVIGEAHRSSSVTKLTRMFRSYNLAVPIFVLTNSGRTPVPAPYRKAGVDDMINAAEMNTPLFT